MLVVASLFITAPLWAEEKILNLKIEGMTCSDCVHKVEKQLSTVCHHAHVSLENGEGMCHYQDPVTPEQILTAAKKTGFKVTVKK